MMREKQFMDEFSWNVLDLEYYWGHVKFASGCGTIHLHILGIVKNKAYLNDFHKAKGEKRRVKILQKCTEDYLNLTADVQVDEIHSKDHNRDTSTMK